MAAFKNASSKTEVAVDALIKCKGVWEIATQNALETPCLGLPLLQHKISQQGSDRLDTTKARACGIMKPPKPMRFHMRCDAVNRRRFVIGRFDTGGWRHTTVSRKLSASAACRCLSHGGLGRWLQCKHGLDLPPFRHGSRGSLTAGTCLQNAYQ